eukprot:CAMPEP_0197457428 /NCGR_PEP_ID=MMETSP1175-20131217/46017_1 /TAXON_ID=1003142 /ORGANISM="Triceratium dubium, Strain CCMP147" /LENGTH=55 /DNA_ID=CAMNT_0042991789 /DNA_START=89 /DNA_END=253 /DNA_ORIENTATION=+
MNFPSPSSSSFASRASPAGLPADAASSGSVRFHPETQIYLIPCQWEMSEACRKDV